MPAITGFHALTYDPAIELGDVVAPPYDVIDAAQRERLARRHRHNFVEIDVPRGDYRAAAATLARWRTDRVLRRDDAAVMYRYDQTFTHPELGHPITRRGILAAVALSPWTERSVRPHERTLRAPREDRARLLAATRTHLSPVFAAYDDPAHRADALFATFAPTPDRIAVTDDGTRHQLWRISDPDAIARWTALLRDAALYVLDGHHRYETMVASGAARGLMFLVAADEPGLVILPTHRIVHGLAAFDAARFLADVGRACELTILPGAARDPARLRAALGMGRDALAADGESARGIRAPAAGSAGEPGVGELAAGGVGASAREAVELSRDSTVESPRGVVEGGDNASESQSGIRDRPIFIAVFPDRPDAYLLKLRDTTQAPDVEVLHDRILAPLGGELRYVSDTARTLTDIARGDGQLALLLRPTPLAQIKRVADAGHVMPQKSTYFFPKLASGLVLMPVDD